MGKRKENTQPNAILDPTTGKLVVSNHNIKAVSLKYCKDTLANNKPHPNYQEEIFMKKKEVEIKLLEEKVDFNISEETFDTIISKFKDQEKKTMIF